MRVSVLVIGLLIGFLLVSQSASIRIFDETPSVVVVGGVGLVMALLWLLASALVIPFPMVSGLLFGLTIPLGLIVPSGDFADLRFPGIMAIVLAGMSFLGWRAKQEQDREEEDELRRQRDRDIFLNMVMHQQHQAQREIREGQIHTTDGVFCTTCGVQAGIRARFCGDCGTSLRQLAGAA